MLENPNLISGIYLEGNRYMIRVVKELDKEELFKLFIEHFCPREPLRTAMFKKFPEKRHHDFAYWDIVKTHYTDEIFGKGMCVGCFDSQNNFEMVGATLVKGSNFSRYDLMKENQFIKASASIKKEMEKSMLPEHMEIIDGGKHTILSQWLYVMKQGHSGKGLMSKMASLCDDLARIKGFQYSNCWASNNKTSKVVQHMGYVKVGEADAKIIEMEGVKIFEYLEEEHRMNTLWLKKISV